jgi:hypothetical protein
MSVLSQDAVAWSAAAAETEGMEEQRVNLDRDISESRQRREQAKVTLENTFLELDQDRVVVPVDENTVLILIRHGSWVEIVKAPIHADASYTITKKLGV